VQNPEDWKWSSYRHYLTGTEGVVEIESHWLARQKERMGIVPKLKYTKLKEPADSTPHPSPKPGERVGHPPTQVSISSIDANGHPLWTYPFPQYHFRPLTVGYDGTVYALVNLTSPGFFESNFNVSHLVALDPQTGKEKFRVPLPSGAAIHEYSRPMMLTDGSLNVAVYTDASTVTRSPNPVMAIPRNNSHDAQPQQGSTTIYCPSEILECWAPVDPSTGQQTDQIEVTEEQETDLFNVQPDGTVHQFSLSQGQIDCIEQGTHYTYVLDDAFLLPGGHVPGLRHDSNGGTILDGHQYQQNLEEWTSGTCGVLSGPNGFDLMVVPNGSGGVLVASETSDDQNPIWVKNIPQPSVSGAGTEFHISSLNTLNNLVIGENGNAFAAGSWDFFDTPRLVSFNINSGAQNWTYDSPFGTPDEPGYVDIVAAGPNNSLYATEGDFFEQTPENAFTLDANGARTDNPTSSQAVTSVTSAGLGSNIWLGQNLNQLASLGGFDLGFGIPFVMQSPPPLPQPGVTAFASTFITPTVSTYGAPSASGKEGRPWYFILVWNNDFTFTPDYPQFLPGLTTDITAQSPIIKQAALQAIKDAYRGFWIVIAEGTAGTGDHRATVLNSQTLVHTPACGATNSNVLQVRDSQVDYLMNMENAQVALRVTINNAEDESAALRRFDLLQAIGRGIGVTTAHEIAHHFLFACCSMDADPATDPLARGTYNATGCSASTDPSPWTGFWPNPIIKLHWEPPALRGLNECLNAGWQDFGSSSCHQ
jgi:outer membrane protein assembly factor BamB